MLAQRERLDQLLWMLSTAARIGKGGERDDDGRQFFCPTQLLAHRSLAPRADQRQVARQLALAHARSAEDHGVPSALQRFADAQRRVLFFFAAPTFAREQRELLFHPRLLPRGQVLVVEHLFEQFAFAGLEQAAVSGAFGLQTRLNVDVGERQIGDTVVARHPLNAALIGILVLTDDAAAIGGKGGSERNAGELLLLCRQTEHLQMRSELHEQRGVLVLLFEQQAGESGEAFVELIGALALREQLAELLFQLVKLRFNARIGLIAILVLRQFFDCFSKAEQGRADHRDLFDLLFARFEQEGKHRAQVACIGLLLDGSSW